MRTIFAGAGGDASAGVDTETAVRKTGFRPDGDVVAAARFLMALFESRPLKSVLGICDDSPQGFP
ncbi:hypothetical protein ACFFX0_09605 [Citricoccus parietis]|uniref:Uncharacterized protein n=1 Tax=Citricoccus parietis TaxID=592307 RepID=A0ABV5FXS0_9MICC